MFHSAGYLSRFLLKGRKMSSAKSTQLLAEVFCTGITALEKQAGLADTFGMSSDMWGKASSVDRVEKYISMLPPRALTSPDYFYAAMHAGLANGFNLDGDTIQPILNLLGTGGYPKDLLVATYPKFNTDTSLEERFNSEAHSLSTLDDDQLKTTVTKQFSISYRPLLESPSNKSFIFTKINHGYWEHFLSIYAKSYSERAAVGGYRALERDGYLLRYSSSGFDRVLAHVLQKMLEHQSVNDTDDRVVRRLSLSFCAGEKPCSVTLKRPLTPVARAAMSGALTFFKSITNYTPLVMGDGSEAKSLIDNRETSAFVDKCVRDADAVLFIVPPHLRDIEIKGLEGTVFKLIIPGSLAHETWRVSLPIYYAYIQDILSKHKRVTVLTQSAVLAPVLGLVQEVDSLIPEGSVLRFFDLGRVLDVAVPEVVAKQGWFKQFANIPLDELSPFLLAEPSSPPVLIS